MVTYTIIKKSGKRYNVTTNPNRRTTIRSGSGFGTGGSPTVYSRSSGSRVDNKSGSGATVSEQIQAQEQTATAEINLQASRQEKEQLQAQATATANQDALNKFNQQINAQYGYLVNPLQSYPQADNKVFNFVNQDTIPQDITRFNNIVNQNRGTSQQTNIQDTEAQAKYDAIYNPKPITLNEIKPADSFTDYTGRYLQELRTATIHDDKTNPFLKHFLKEGGGQAIAGGLNVIASGSQLLFKPIDFAKDTGSFFKGFLTGESQIALGTSAITEPVKFATEIFLTEGIIRGATKLPIKINDYYRTFNRDKIGRESVTKAEVISGEQRFPYDGLTPEQLKQSFGGVENPFVQNLQRIYDPESLFYSETVKAKPNIKGKGADALTEYLDKLGKELITDKKSSEIFGFSAVENPLIRETVLSKKELKAEGVPIRKDSGGLFQAPSLSENFLKIGTNAEGYSYSLLPKFRLGKPTVYPTISEAVRTFPEEVVAKAKQSSDPFAYLENYREKNFKQGESYVSELYTLGKKESEIKGIAGSRKVEVPAPNKEIFTKIEGRRIPFRAIRLVPDDVPITEIKIQGGGKAKLISDKEISSNTQSYYDALAPKSGDLFTDSLSASSIKSNVKGSSNSIFDASNIMVLQPSTQLPSSSTTQTGSVSISGVPSSSSSGKNPFGSLPSLSYTSSKIPPPPPPPPSSTPKRSSGGGSGGSSNIFIPPSSPPPSDSGGALSIIPPIKDGGFQITDFNTTNIYPPQIPQRTISIFPSLRKKRTRQEQAFDVLTRRKGIFRKVNVRPLTRQSAIDFGTYKVGSDSSATFKLQSVFGTPTTQKKRGKIENFYRKGNLFIEKKEKRIKRTSPKELQEITFKGIASNKAKKKKGKKKKSKSIFGGVIKWA